MGHPGHPEHPDVQAAIDTIVTRTAAAGKAVAMSVGSMDDMVRRRKQGASIFILGSDYRFIRDGIKEKIAGARAALR